LRLKTWLETSVYAHFTGVSLSWLGWGEKKMSYELRLTAAKSELLLYRKHPSPYIVFALLKYILVTVFRF